VLDEPFRGQLQRRLRVTGDLAIKHPGGDQLRGPEVRPRLALVHCSQAAPGGSVVAAVEGDDRGDIVGGPLVERVVDLLWQVRVGQRVVPLPGVELHLASSPLKLRGAAGLPGTLGQPPTGRQGREALLELVGVGLVDTAVEQQQQPHVGEAGLAVCGRQAG